MVGLALPLFVCAEFCVRYGVHRNSRSFAVPENLDVL